VMPFKSLSSSEQVWFYLRNPRRVAAFEIDFPSKKTISGDREIHLYPNARGDFDVEPLHIVLDQPAPELSAARLTIRLPDVTQSWQGMDVVPLSATSASADSGLSYRLEDEILQKSGIELRPGEPWAVQLRLTNTGRAVWLNQNFGGSRSCPQIYGTVHVGFFWYRKKDFEALVSLPGSFEGAAKAEAVPVGRIVRPGEQVDLRAQLKTPDEPGDYVICMDLVSHCVTWFKDVGDNRIQKIEVRVSRERVAF